MDTIPAFVSATQALDMVRAGLRFVAAADATQLTAEERAACLRGLEQADAAATAARTSVLGAFGAGQDYVDDGDYSPFSWLVHRTQVTRGTAADHTGWVKRSAAHPAVHAALAAEAISTSYVREICRWTGKLSADARAAADEILLAAAASGLELEDLAALAAEMYERSRQDKPDTDDGDRKDGNPGDGFDDRAVKLATTIGGAGLIRGDLTPSARSSCRPSWTPWPRRPGQMIAAAMSSGITTRCRRRCGGCWRPGCCRNGPGSRSRRGRISRWRT